MISFKEALKIHSSIPLKPLEIEVVSLFESIGRVLAEDIICTHALPKFNQSAMDGYGFKMQDLGKKTQVIQHIFAGDDVSTLEVKENECVKIMTGAMVPKGIETIVPIECMLESHENFALAPKDFKIHANIRQKGENASLNSVLVPKNTRLNYGHIALIASQGFKEIKAFRKLKIALFSSGDELVPLGQNALECQVYDVNSVGVFNMLKNYNTHFLGVLKDDKNLQLKILELQDYDVILSSAGVSVGDKDFFKDALKEKNALFYYEKINLKPGKPVTLAQLNQSIIIGLPGNPLSCLLVLRVLILPLLERLSLNKDFKLNPFKAQINAPLKLNNKRAHLILGNYSNHQFIPYNNNRYESGAIQALAQVDSIALIDEGVGLVQGEIEILRFEN
ncbi:molybdopterin molybdenumtransferase MoeA [Helicobacter pylori]|uniref:molybdopterin molybdotransferase MoeA n=1 Tax=Helicobacter pylori TaxID=210 RepID=UPI000991B47A|nr:molybdopterin molybdotransferase MoeA [Helicobacter pylori]OOP89843.1 molybdopterin molybdenumtransferase MoeA [Helicobacter pylori]PDW70563.1 molybdopterin molybdenumtransferase MoeA [Helicobacter pylori]PDW72452.1 molybdopterin molybdenumtransferase MoeA [Helicobacter pylori]